MAHRMEVLPGASAAVVVKRAHGAAVDALRAEAERLRAASHPGVVEVLASAGTEEEWELRLAHAGRPLATLGPLATAQVAGLAAALAATLADLHDAGIVHGRVDRDHVLISGQGRPVLCGFGASTTAGPADDVAAVGALLAELLGPAAEASPIPERRWRRRPGSDWDRRSLLHLADQACAEPPGRRPTARRLAAAITATVPDAQLRPPADDAAPPPGDDPIESLRASATGPSPAARGRLPQLAGAAVIVLLVAVGAVRTARPGASPTTVAAPPPWSATSATTGRASVPEPPTTDLRPTTTRPEAPAAPCVVLPGTADGGCASVQVDGTTVQAGATRYEVGEPGDELVLGDWDCDGVATPALLRPTTGDVFVFRAWPVTGEVVVHAAARIPGAVHLEVVAGPGACSGLVARTPSGTVPLALGGSA